MIFFFFYFRKFIFVILIFLYLLLTFVLFQIYIIIDQNLIQIAVNVIVNCGLREDFIRIDSIDIIRRQIVDVSFLRRVNQIITFFTIDIRETIFRNIKNVIKYLTEKLINAIKENSNNYAIKKKNELKRITKSNR